MKDTQPWRLLWILQVLIFSGIFAFSYILSVVVGQNSLIVQQAHFNVDWTFRCRFIIPYLIYHIFPEGMPDTIRFRIFFAALSFAGSMLLIRPYAARIGASYEVVKFVPVTFFLIMIMHYCLPKELNAYYVYDIPSVTLYLGTFLLLTSRRNAVFRTGIGCAIFCTLSRETIVIAVFHAAAVLFAQQTIQRQEKIRRAVGLFLAFIGIISLRLGVIHLLGGQPASAVSLRDGETIRMMSNWHNILQHMLALNQVILLGASLLLWLPFLLPKLNRLQILLALTSIPPICALLIAGNFIELRVYNELVPLMACFLGEFCSRTYGARADSLAAS